jgi:hypothetical protein
VRRQSVAATALCHSETFASDVRKLSHDQSDLTDHLSAGRKAVSPLRSATALQMRLPQLRNCQFRRAMLFGLNIWHARTDGLFEADFGAEQQRAET